MVLIGQHRNVAGTLVIACALLAQPAVAQGSGRVPVPPEGVAAFEKREFGKAAGIIIPAFEACRTTRPQGAACADLANAVALLVAVAGNEKTEATILAAQDYIDTRVGRESADALGMLNMLSSYYDRVLDMNKFGPVAERRYSLARKLHGPLGRPTVMAAISLCIVQWNLGKGQAAVDLMTPLHGKLPEKTPDDLELSARVHDCTGTAYYTMDKNREAEAEFRKALTLFERAGGETSSKTIDVMASLANTLRRLGRDGEALALAKRVEGLAKPGSDVMTRIDWARAGASDPLEAARIEFAQAEARYGATSPVTDMAGASYGIALIEAGRFAEAEPFVARLEAAASNAATPASVRIKLLIGRIAMITTQDKGRFDRALPVIEQLVAVAKRSDAGSDKLLIDFQMYAGALLNAQAEPARAYPYLSDAGRRLLARIASYRDFDAAAQRETRDYSPVFRFKVATAWRLAQRQ
jgi:tetratricopeptide (TPR) repeat protein